MKEAYRTSVAQLQGTLHEKALVRALLKPNRVDYLPMELQNVLYKNVKLALKLVDFYQVVGL